MRTTQRSLLAVVALTTFGALSVLPATAAAPVKNDTPSTALNVRRLPYSKTVNMTNADDTTGPAYNSFGCIGSFTATPEDIWYTFTPATNQTVTADTGGSDLRGDTDVDYYDTLLAVYTYDGTSWTPLACNDDGSGLGGNRSKVEIAVTAGTTYYFRAGSFGGSTYTAGYTPLLRFNLSVSPA